MPSLNQYCNERETCKGCPFERMQRECVEAFDTNLSFEVVLEIVELQRKEERENEKKKLKSK